MDTLTPSSRALHAPERFSRVRRAVPFLLAAGLVVMWSSGFVGAELGTGYAPATTLLAWRFLIVGGLLVAWCLCRGMRMGGRDLALHAGIGALAQAGYLYGVVAAAEAGVAAGTSALVAALQPVVAAALALPLLGERVRGRQILGLAVGLAGVGLVVGSDLLRPAAAPWWAYALPFGAMLSLVAATLVERRARPGGSLLEALAVQCGVSAVLFTALAGATGTLAPPADPGFWGAVAWVVVLSTLGGYGLYWANLARTSVARVSALLYLTPPTTLVWTWLMFGAPVSAGALAGMGVCVLAVWLVRSPAR
ncbi:DMT family transporter [Nocardiopsis metallicus]|uniref:Drug/metabolite transporter (DMT)-like permease n=1 Tax=Nocardiopsis metallicus TaxID=179819 RepID=A0A840W8Z0_9ACTN|nr:DMT family transporter [Nocardiopsis metallicus]MBB5489521.1 drug/metabolite transporter (DMT)-like permease [Nocardiopsis metallicus]